LERVLGGRSQRGNKERFIATVGELFCYRPNGKHLWKPTSPIYIPLPLPRFQLMKFVLLAHKLPSGCTRHCGRRRKQRRGGGGAGRTIIYLCFKTIGRQQIINLTLSSTAVRVCCCCCCCRDRAKHISIERAPLQVTGGGVPW